MNNDENGKIIIHIIHFKDLCFTVKAEPKEYHVDYVIYDQAGEGENGEIIFHKEYKNGSVWVDDLNEADPYLHGSVKWDGCSNWYFDEQDRVMLHGCSKEDLERYGKIMGECWEMTKKLCPNWQDM